MDPLAASLARSPELFPLDLDTSADRAILIRLTEAEYRQASFLDARVVRPPIVTRQVAWQQLEAAVAATDLPEAADFIFHIGHVGSTLLSRLLGVHPQIFAVREPGMLRTFAQMRFCSDQGGAGWRDATLSVRLAPLLRLLSRTFRPGQRALVKATSFVSEVAPQILARTTRPKALLIWVPAEIYLASILGAPNSPREARVLAQSRLERLHARLGQQSWAIADLSEGEMVAMSWACERAALTAAADAGGERVLWLDFERFLRSPASALTDIFRHLTLPTTEEQIEMILSGPDLRRYAKAPEHPYDAMIRRQVLDQARRDCRVEIERGLQWLRALHATAPKLHGPIFNALY